MLQSPVLLEVFKLKFQKMDLHAAFVFHGLVEAIKFGNFSIDPSERLFSSRRARFKSLIGCNRIDAEFDSES